MDEFGEHHSQQTDTRTENETPFLTCRWLLNNENTWTQEGKHHTMGSFGGARGGTEEDEEVGEG